VNENKNINIEKNEIERKYSEINYSHNEKIE